MGTLISREELLKFQKHNTCWYLSDVTFNLTISIFRDGRRTDAPRPAKTSSTEHINVNDLSPYKRKREEPIETVGTKRLVSGIVTTSNKKNVSIRITSTNDADIRATQDQTIERSYIHLRILFLQVNEHMLSIDLLYLLYRRLRFLVRLLQTSQLHESCTIGYEHLQ